MRSTFVLLILGAAVACGDSNNSTPDAPKHPDAHQDDAAADAAADATSDAAPDAAPDAAVDAGPDAPGDGGMAPQSRVWVTGDFVTDGTTQAGWLTDGDTLPATPAVVPAAPAVLASGSGYSAFVFDATQTKTAYVADVTTAGTFDLYAADADGTNPTLLVAGQANVEIATVALSPDGTKAAFMMDSTALDGAYDVWVVNTAGTPVPLLVSPARNVMAPDLTRLSAFTGSLTWSSDSKYIGFSGDFNTDGISQPYAVDTTAATPAAVELMSSADIGTNSVRGDVDFDATDMAYFRAGSGSTFALYQVGADGTNRTALALPMRGDNTTSSVGTFAISPDGTSIVFAADAPTLNTYDVYASPLATFNPARLTAGLTVNANSHPDFNSPMWISPDNGWVAFDANYMASVNEAYAAKLDGTDAHRLVHFTVANTRSRAMNWTRDSAAIYMAGNFDASNSRDVYRIVPGMTDQTPTKVIEAPASGSIENVLIREK